MEPTLGRRIVPCGLFASALIYLPVGMVPADLKAQEASLLESQYLSRTAEYSESQPDSLDSPLPDSAAPLPADESMEVNDAGGPPPSVAPAAEAFKGGLPAAFSVTLPDQPVGNSGAYSFSIPLDFPAGKAGLQPAVALSYSSDGPRRSLLGAGWTLEAGSCIERRGGARTDSSGNWIFPAGVPQYWDSDGQPYCTFGHDGFEWHYLERNTNDIFYVDGTRLVPCRNDIASCPEGTYATEKTFERAVAKQVGSLSDELGWLWGWWLAKNDGTIWEYTHAEVAEDRGTWDFNEERFSSIAKWCVSSISRDNSRIQYDYQDWGDGFQTVASIKYGGWDDSDQKFEIALEWEDRPDITESYQSARLVRQTKRLSAIEVRALVPSQTRIRRYQIQYEQSPDTGASRVTSIQEFGANDLAAAPAYAFAYPTASQQGWESASASGLSEENSFLTIPMDLSVSSVGLYKGVVPVDINGDGLVDLIRKQAWSYADPTPHTEVEQGIWLQSHASGWSDASASLEHVQTSLTHLDGWHNLDGPDAWMFLADCGGYGYCWALPHVDYTARFVDLNRDGHVDSIRSMAWKDPPNYHYVLPVVKIWNPALNGGLGGFDRDLGAAWESALEQRDVAFDRTLRHVWLPIGLWPDWVGPELHQRAGNRRDVIDINGDGLPDIANGSTNNLINNGHTFTDPPATDFLNLDYPSYCHPPSEYAFNGGNAYAGGYSELAIPDWEQASGDHLLSCVYPRSHVYADLNGDGLPDLLYLRRTRYWENHDHFNRYYMAPPEYYGQVPDTWHPDQYSWEVKINTGADWVLHQGWTDALGTLATNHGLAFGEMNWARGDPLSYGYPDYFHDPRPIVECRNHEQAVQVMDVNGDGLDDLVQTLWENQTDLLRTFINTGSGFVLDPDWKPAYATIQERIGRKSFPNHEVTVNWNTTSASVDQGVRYIDLNTDGLTDMLVNYNSYAGNLRARKTNKVRFDRDLLTSITTPRGATTSITYQLSSQSGNHPHLPHSRPLVSQITTGNGITSGPAAWSKTRRFHYFDGRVVDGKFAGFRAVSIEDQLEDGQKVFNTSWFLNTDEDYCRTGQLEHSVTSEKLCDGSDGVSGTNCIYDRETYDPSVDPDDIVTFKVYSLQSNTWANSCPSDRRGPFIGAITNPTQTYSTTYNPLTPGLQKTSKIERLFDPYGNVAWMKEFEDAADSVPLRMKFTSYNPPDDYFWVSSRPCFEVTYLGEAVRQVSKIFYDGSTSLCEPIYGWGHPTRNEISGQSASGQWLSTANTRTFYASGNLQSETDALGHTTEYFWNDPLFGDLLLSEIRSPEVTGHPRVSRQFVYNQFALLETAKNQADCEEQRNEYDGLHRLTRSYTRTCEGETSRLPEEVRAYANFGSPAQQYIEVSTRTGSSSFRRERSYFDGLGRSYLEESPDAAAGNIRSTTYYNLQGLPAVESVPYIGTYLSSEIGTARLYDVLGREVRRTVPGGYVFDTAHGLARDGAGRTYLRETSSVNRGDAVLKRHLLRDSLGRLVKVAECAGPTCSDPFSGAADIYLTTYNYNHDDQITLVCMADGNGDCSNPASSKSVHFYDGLGRSEAVKDADVNNCLDPDPLDLNSGCAAKFSYDAAGRLETSMDPKAVLGLADGVITEHVHDALNRLVERRAYRGAPQQSVPEFTYSFNYDLPDGACPFEQERLVGRLASEAVRRGESAQNEVFRCYSYDAAGRVARKSVTINLPGRTSEQVWFEYWYNNEGTLSWVTTRRANEMHYVSYEFNTDGSVRTVQSSLPGAGTLVSEVVYNELNKLASYRLGNGARVNMSYRLGAPSTPGGDRRLRNLTAKKSTGALLLGLTYDYDPAGNIRSITDSLQERLSYTYDSLNRLAEFRKDNEIQEQYQYDRLGNRTGYSWREKVSDTPYIPIELPSGQAKSTSPLSTGTTDSLNGVLRQLPGSYITHTRYVTFGAAYQGQAGAHAPKSVSDRPQGAPDSVEALEYDTNGNLTLQADYFAGTTRSFAYNHDNKLATSSSGYGTVEYFYGPQSEKVAVIDNGRLIYTIDPLVDIVAGQLSFNLDLMGKPLATYSAAEGIRYSLVDHLGSVRIVINGAQNVRKTMHYKPFGEIKAQYGDSVLERRRFNGNSQDSSGILYYDARSYDPRHGVFLQADTIVPDYTNPQTLNRYSYVMNNPLNFIDPSGHSPEEDDEEQEAKSALMDAVSENSNSIRNSEPASAAQDNTRTREPDIQAVNTGGARPAPREIPQLRATERSFSLRSSGKSSAPSKLPDVRDYVSINPATGTMYVSNPDYGKDFRAAIAANPALKAQAQLQADRTRSVPVIGPIFIALPEAATGQTYTGDPIGGYGRLAAGGEAALGLWGAAGLLKGSASGLLRTGASSAVGALKAQERYNKAQQALQEKP